MKKLWLFVLLTFAFNLGLWHYQNKLNRSLLDWEARVATDFKKNEIQYDGKRFFVFTMIPLSDDELAMKFYAPLYVLESDLDQYINQARDYLIDAAKQKKALEDAGIV